MQESRFLKVGQVMMAQQQSARPPRRKISGLQVPGEDYYLHWGWRPLVQEFF